MRTLFAISLLSATLGTCAVLCLIALYAAGGLAAAQTTRMLPFVGPIVGPRIEAWVLGSTEPLVADTSPVPIATGEPAPQITPIVTPIPGDPNCAKPYIYPVEARVTSRFGWRVSPFPPHVREFHAGIDFSAGTGTAVHATMCGTVTFAGWSDLYGWQVSVSNGNITTLYGHNSELLVAEGQQVSVGQIVALSGSTGRSTAPHVHYGISVDGVWVDPEVAFGIG